MSNQAKRQYLQAIIDRYKAATKREKTKILDEFSAVCGYGRKYAVVLLSGKMLPDKSQKRRGHPPVYPPELLLPHIRFLWFRMGQISGRLMKEAFKDWLPRYKENGVTLQVIKLLEEISASTLERMLKQLRCERKSSKGLSSTYPAKYMQNKIPLRTFDADIDRPGHTQTDTVAHCGTTLVGQFAHSVTVTDIDSTWTEARAIYTKQGSEVKMALSDIEDSLPFAILALNSDSGSEFLNEEVANFAWDHKGRKIDFTRSRPYKKNDNCFVEQKNYTYVRDVFGYERIDDLALVEMMNDIYVNYWLPLHNFFIPTFKILEKVRMGSQIKKKYGPPVTPYQRLMTAKYFSESRKQALKKRYDALDPFDLSEGLGKKLHAFNLRLKQSKMGDKHESLFNSQNNAPLLG